MSGTKFKVKEYTQHTDSQGVMYEFGAEVTKEFPVEVDANNDLSVVSNLSVPTGNVTVTQGSVTVTQGSVTAAEVYSVGNFYAGNLSGSEDSTLEVIDDLVFINSKNLTVSPLVDSDDRTADITLNRNTPGGSTRFLMKTTSSSGSEDGARFVFEGDVNEDVGTPIKYGAIQASYKPASQSSEIVTNVLTFDSAGGETELLSATSAKVVAQHKATLQGSKVTGDDTGVQVTATGNCAITATEDISLTATDRISVGTGVCPIAISGSEVTVGTIGGDIGIYSATGAISVATGPNQNLSISGGTTSISTSDTTLSCSSTLDIAATGSLEVTTGGSSTLKATGTGQNYVEAGSGGVYLKTRSTSGGGITLDSDANISLLSNRGNTALSSQLLMGVGGVTISTPDVSIDTDNTDGNLVVSTVSTNKYRKGIKSEGGRLYVGELSNPSLFNTDGYCLEVFCFGTNDNSADYDTGDVYIRSAGSIQILTSERAEGTHQAKDIQFGISNTPEGPITSRNDVGSIRVRIDTWSGITYFDESIVTNGATMTFTGGHAYLSKSEVAVGLAVDINGNYAEASSSPLSKKCAGIVMSCQLVSDMRDVNYISSMGVEPADGDYLVYTASVGDTRTKNCPGFNICNENGEVQAGDLLVTSSTPGYLMKQDDDIIRSSTVGKAMEDVVFDESGQATGIYGYIYCG